MLIVPPCGPWEIYPQRRACNRLVSHFPATYQRRWSTCSDGCSTSNKTVDRHPCLTLVLFNSISMEWGGVFCVGKEREKEKLLPTVVVRRGFRLGCALCQARFYFFSFRENYYVGISLDVFFLCFCVVFFFAECKANVFVCFLFCFVFWLLSSFFFACQMLVVIYQLTVMTIEIHMGANISQVATRNKLIKWQHITHTNTFTQSEAINDNKTK